MVQYARKKFSVELTKLPHLQNLAASSFAVCIKQVSYLLQANQLYQFCMYTIHTHQLLCSMFVISYVAAGKSCTKFIYFLFLLCLATHIVYNLLRTSYVRQLTLRVHVATILFHGGQKIIQLLSEFRKPNHSNSICVNHHEQDQS